MAPEDVRVKLRRLTTQKAVEWDFFGSNIGNDGARIIAEALKVNSTAQTVNFRCNEIGDEGAKFIAQALKVNSTVQTINLESNDIGDEGAKFIAQALTVNSMVQTINLESNNIGTEGARAIAHVLKVNSTLQTIGFENNDIGHEGAKAIAETLKVNTTLKAINFGRNGIGVNRLLGILGVADQLQRNRSYAEKDQQIRELQKAVQEWKAEAQRGVMVACDEGEIQKLRVELQSVKARAEKADRNEEQLRTEMAEANARAMAEEGALRRTVEELKAKVHRARLVEEQLVKELVDAQARAKAGAGAGTEFGKANRHALGMVQGEPKYIPIKDFVMDFVPSKPCSRYIAEDCATAFEMMEENSTAFFPKLMEEATRTTESMLEHVQPPAGDWSCAFAIVSYSMDLHGTGKNQNFYSLINSMLQNRNKELIELCQGYLHFLFKGLRALPMLPRKTFFRGLPPEQLGMLKKHYRRTRNIHWSGLSSMSESETVAWQFATFGGVVIRVVAFSARSIERFSAFPGEHEALLLPNFRAVVMKEPHKEGDRWFLDIEETNEVSPHVF